MTAATCEGGRSRFLEKGELISDENLIKFVI